MAGAVLVPALLLAAGAWTAWRAAWSEADRELTVAAEAAAEFAQRVIEGHARLAARIAESLEGADDDAIRAAEPLLHDRLARFVADLPLVRDAVVIGRDGAVLVRSAASPPGTEDASGRDFFAGLGGEGASMPLIGAAQRRGDGAVFAIGRWRDAAGGAVAILLDANRMGARMGQVLHGEGNSAALVRADGQILARDPPFLDPPAPLAAGLPLPAALAAGERRGTLRGVTPRDGQAVRIAFQRLDAAPGLAVAVARPEWHVLENWWRAMMPLLAIGLPALLGLGALAWVALRQQHALELTLAGLERRVADRTASLREGEERLRVAIGAGRFGTWETDLHSGMTTRSAWTREIFGLGEHAAVSPVTDWSTRIHPADGARVLDAWQRTASGGKADYREEYRFQRPDGTWIWVEDTAAVVRRDPATGAPLRIAGTVRDITGRREEEERRDLLVQEVNHRARNALAIVQAILRLTRAEDAAAFARVVEGRVAALARAQSLLAAEAWTGAPLATLLRDELAPYGGGEPEAGQGRPRLAAVGPPLRLRAEAVQPLAMVFHELATNAAKHGALSTPEGRVAVSWQVDEAAGLLRIRWTETGGPAPGFPQRRGVGSRVIEATIAGQLGGAVERRWPAEGLTCDITVPLARVRAGPG